MNTPMRADLFQKLKRLLDEETNGGIMSATFEEATELLHRPDAAPARRDLTATASDS